jgi:CRP-like cAMP-binding protein
MVQTNRLDRRELLQRMTLLQGLAPREIDALVGLTATKRLRAGEVLCHKGAPGTTAYAVVSGRLRVTASGDDGREVVMRILDPGEVLGEIALLDGGPRSVTVDALEPAELLVLQRRDFLPFLAQRPAVAVKMLAKLGTLIRTLTEQLEDSMFLDIRARLAKKLLALAASYGSRVPGGTRIELRMSQSDLASMIGATRESVNKHLRAWTREGVLRSEKGYVTLLREDRLRDHPRAEL